MARTSTHAYELARGLAGIPMVTITTKHVWARGGKECGNVVGRGGPCRLEGCTGWRVSVRWPNGKLTRPCTKGMFTRSDGDYQIGGD